MTRFSFSIDLSGSSMNASRRPNFPRVEWGSRWRVTVLLRQAFLVKFVASSAYGWAGFFDLAISGVLIAQNRIRVVNLSASGILMSIVSPSTTLTTLNCLLLYFW